MKVFLTGATGFLGGKILEQLQEKYEFRLLVRDTKAIKKFNAQNIETIQGDLLSVTADNLKGVDVVVHTAALAKPYGKRRDFEEINVKGTENIVNAAKLAGVKRFVHISTEAVCFFGKDLINIDEKAPVLHYPKYGYAFSKALAEKFVLGSTTNDFSTVALRPSWIWGPGDTNALPMMVELIKNDKFMWVDHGIARKTTTYVYNLVAAIDASIQSNCTGEAFFVNDGEYLTLKDFLTQLMATQNISIPKKSVPGWFIRIIGALAESVWNITGQRGKPAGTRMEADFMSREIVISNERAKKILGWNPKFTISEGMKSLK